MGPTGTTGTETTDERIFVQIAGYRDAELPRTLADALARAERPERLRFAICAQHDAADAIDLDPWRHDSRVRIDDVAAHLSQGTCWARARTQQFYDDEPFVLQLDSHMRFAPAWDTRLCQMLTGLGGDRPVLSAYPLAYEHGDDGRDVLDDNPLVPRLELLELRPDLTPRLIGVPTDPPDRPWPSFSVSGNFLFTVGRFLREVPSDPEMYFEAEEVSLAVRAFTHGYDMYCPNENLLWHRYLHDAPKHWSDHTEEVQHSRRRERERLAHLLVGDHDRLGRYGLGTRRTRETWADGLGLDLELIVDPDLARRARLPRRHQSPGAPGPAPHPLPTSMQVRRPADTEAPIPPAVVRHHRLEGLVPISDEQPDDWRRVAARHGVARAMLTEIREIIDGPIVLLKGLELAQLHPVPARRTFIDLDLLVPDPRAAWLRLLRAGFEQQADEPWHPRFSHAPPALHRPGLPVAVDLHGRPNWPSWRVCPVDEIFAAAEPGRVGLAGVSRPADRHHGLIVACHAWEEGLPVLRDLVEIEALRRLGGAAELRHTAAEWDLAQLWARTERLIDSAVTGERPPGLVERALVPWLHPLRGPTRGEGRTIRMLAPLVAGDGRSFVAGSRDRVLRHLATAVERR